MDTDIETAFEHAWEADFGRIHQTDRDRVVAELARGPWSAPHEADRVERPSPETMRQEIDATEGQFTLIADAFTISTESDYAGQHRSTGSQGKYWHRRRRSFYQARHASIYGL